MYISPEKCTQVRGGGETNLQMMLLNIMYTWSCVICSYSHSTLHSLSFSMPWRCIVAVVSSRGPINVTLM